MSDFPLPSLRKEVLEYLRYSEHLISAAATDDVLPFTPQERELVAYYLEEVGKILTLYCSVRSSAGDAGPLSR